MIGVDHSFERHNDKMQTENKNTQRNSTTTMSSRRGGGPVQCLFCDYWSMTTSEWNSHNRACWAGYEVDDDLRKRKSLMTNIRSIKETPVVFKMPAIPERCKPIDDAEHSTDGFELDVTPLPVPRLVRKHQQQQPVATSPQKNMPAQRRQNALRQFRQRQKLEMRAPMRLLSASLFDSLKRNQFLSPKLAAKLTWALQRYRLQTVHDLILLPRMKYELLCSNISFEPLREQIALLRG